MKIAFWLVVGFALSSIVIDASAATCARANVDGFLYLSTDPLAECTGHVLMDSTEYSQVPTLQSLFAWPESDQMVAAWMAGFTIPMICYLAAWGFGVVVNFLKPENERY
jgi:hypothetical protein